MVRTEKKQKKKQKRDNMKKNSEQKLGKNVTYFSKNLILENLSEQKKMFRPSFLKGTNVTQ